MMTYKHDCLAIREQNVANQARIAALEAFIQSVIDDPRATVSQIRDARAALAKAGEA